jgi:hypothetical protein
LFKVVLANLKKLICEGCAIATAASIVLSVLRPEESENGFYLNNRYSSDFLKTICPNVVV